MLLVLPQQQQHPVGLLCLLQQHLRVAGSSERLKLRVMAWMLRVETVLHAACTLLALPLPAALHLTEARQQHQLAVLLVLLLALLVCQRCHCC